MNPLQQILLSSHGLCYLSCISKQYWVVLYQKYRTTRQLSLTQKNCWLRWWSLTLSYCWLSRESHFETLDLYTWCSRPFEQNVSLILHSGVNVKLKKLHEILFIFGMTAQKDVFWGTEYHSLNNRGNYVFVFSHLCNICCLQARTHILATFPYFWQSFSQQ